MIKSGLDRFLLSFFLILFILLLNTCASVKDHNKNSIIIENFPFYPQTAYQCGPAALAGVLNFWGIYVTPDEIADEIYSESARGTLSIDMSLYVQRKGLRAIQYKGDIQDLRENIDTGYPVIVLIDSGFSLYQINHFMVVIGYNEYGFIVNSGKEREKFISEKYFMHSWGKTKFWTLLIKPNE
ncbi:MAG: peptidase C39 family protein [Nitrospirae bacterium]|nr:peptidase C39 family protein [Nitrospirota bacterium]